MIKRMDMVLWNMLIKIFMRVNLKMIKNVDREK
jgi:hypothetical protein